MSMKHTVKYFLTAIAVAATLGLTGCSSKLNLTAKSDNGIDVEFSTSLGKVLSSTIKSVTSNLGDGAKPVPLFSADAIKLSMKDSDFQNIKVSTPDENSLNLAGSLPTADKQTHASGNIRAVDFVSCNSNLLILKLSPKNLKTFADNLPQETKNYLDLFMAPVFTGEFMSIEDYKMLIASIYGENIAKELEQSSITVTLAPPKGKNIKNAGIPKKGSATATKATFSIPLLDFLTLSTEQVYSIQW